MKQRLSINQPPTQHKTTLEEEAIWDTYAKAGQDPGRIASLAFALYEQRGREDGHDLADWLEAEQRIMSGGEGRGF